MNELIETSSCDAKLMDIINSNRENELIKILDSGFDPNYKITVHQRNDKYKYPLLIYAILREHLKLVKILLEYGADPNLWASTLQTPLEMAIDFDQPEIFQLLLENGATLDKPKTIKTSPYTTWDRVIWTNNLKIAIILIQHGFIANISLKESLYMWALRSNPDNDEMCNLLYPYHNITNNDCRDEFGHSALMIAAENGRYHQVKKLLDENVDINATGNENGTALILALNNNHLKIVKLLIYRGALIPDHESYLLYSNRKKSSVLFPGYEYYLSEDDKARLAVPPKPISECMKISAVIESRKFQNNYFSIIPFDIVDVIVNIIMSKHNLC